ncbi:hypothetical protein TIN2_66 [Tsukamurella phage TIN2]|uniref:Uncharacterized protein n=1 Tax=Tsukamurella phage TIN2 TaxID=1636545 RepID=A0A0K0N595_9CAUD|nr:hypothetical protein AVT55_gp057 [Tsukamurella phage TIN2]AKJ71756.1 hypothetical protein TIN2_66 [Tsukamurella phage TIN2]
MNVFDFKDAIMKLMAKNKSGTQKILFVDRANGEVYEAIGFKYSDKTNIVEIQPVE